MDKRYAVYYLNMSQDPLKRVNTHTFTDSIEVANAAMEECAGKIGSALFVLLVEDGILVKAQSGTSGPK